MSSVRFRASQKSVRVLAVALTTALFFFLAPVYRAYAISTIAFSEPVGYPTGVAQDVRSATTADVDNDGDQDLVSGVLSGVVQTRLNDGTGTFGPAISSAVTGGAGAWWTATGDFDGDAYVDVVVANFWEKRLTVLLGDGAGNFTAQAPIPIGDNRPLQVIVADFDDDGSLDLAAAGSKEEPGEWRGMLSVALNNGDGTFGTATNTSTQAYYGSKGVASADIDDDGDLDLLVGQNNSKYYGGYGRDVGVFLGDGSGGFTHSTDLNVAIGIRGIQLADLDDDGAADLIATWVNSWYSQYHGTSVMLGDGSGGFGSATLLNGSASPGGEITIPTAADFDSDGALDVLVPILSDKQTQVFPGDGQGSFTDPIDVLANPYDNSVYSAVPADVNDDGLPDIVTGNHGWTQSGTIFDSSTGVNFNTTEVEVPPQISGVPTISGDAVEGQVLSAHMDSVVVTGDPVPDTESLWQVSGDGSSGWTDIAGATGATFTLTGDQVGKYVRLLFTATNTAGSAEVASAATAQVAALPVPTPTPTPTPTPPAPTPSLPPQLANACPSGSCVGADLSGLNLAGLDLRGIDFAGANLAGADLRGADLRGADLHGADLHGVDLRSADLRGSDLRNANLVRANLVGANLAEADLRNADLREARFSTRISRGDALRFRAANLRKADLRGATLTAAKLAGSDLRKADLRKVVANRADFRAVDAKRAKFNRANLNRANFAWADLRLANFTHATVKNTRFTHAQFD